MPGRVGRVKRARAARYGKAVADVMAAEFDAAADPTAHDLICRAVIEFASEPPVFSQRGTTVQFEVIVDHVMTANWRLKPDMDEPGRVRLADYRFSSIGGPISERESRVNGILDTVWHAVYG